MTAKFHQIFPLEKLLANISRKLDSFSIINCYDNDFLLLFHFLLYFWLGAVHKPRGPSGGGGG